MVSNTLPVHILPQFDGTTYRASNMILCAHANAGFHNESRGRSRAGAHIFANASFHNESRDRSRACAHIFFSKNDPFPKCNGPVLSIFQTMKSVMSSATKAVLGTLYTTAKEMVPLHQTLIKMGWPQMCTPIQTDNSTAIDVTTSPLSHKRPSPWTSANGGSNAKNLNNSTVTTGTKAATIGQTTT
jgi:hypothetical protein